MEELIRFITLDENKIVRAIRWGKTIVKGEIQSDIGEVGQVQQADGSFITPTPIPQPIPITLEELYQNQLTVMNAIADLYSALPTTTT